MVMRFFRIYLPLAGASLCLAIGWMQTFHTSPVTPQSFPAYFYQHVIGSLDGRSCPSFPVCSQYAAQATHQYGLLIGSWLTLDRLIHEGGDLQSGPWLYVDGKERLNDPIERNAFWL
ncbi:MAG: membrane protein insertion efficiency factor YidD [Mariprofundus sp.]|nr:membrane protein insertion efficiency factor YidD [Mariprofundus sp.]